MKRGQEKWERRKGDQEWKERGRKDGERDRPESAVKALRTSLCICQPWQQQAQPHKGSSGSDSARCTAPTSHAGHETATESAAEIAVFVRLKTRPRRSPRVVRSAHLDSRSLLRACDIGSGGLDHPLSSRQDVHIFVLDTEGCSRYFWHCDDCLSSREK